MRREKNDFHNKHRVHPHIICERGRELTQEVRKYMQRNYLSMSFVFRNVNKLCVRKIDGFPASIVLGERPKTG